MVLVPDPLLAETVGWAVIMVMASEKAIFPAQDSVFRWQ